ncbi:MAG: Hybrid sensor histidine kinase/response regulator [Nitrospira sp.]|nr:MAG: Hybrid sensor histidine kinase/response regulator [Nitrospira sp.]
MSVQPLGGIEPAVMPLVELLPKERRILDRPFMEFRPFGLDEQGQTIRDLSGMSIRAVILDLEKTLTRERGEGAGSEAVNELCVLLNWRIKDSVYHVTPEFLKNPWNSYSYEFAAYLYEFCELLTGDPNFLFTGGMEKMSPIIQVLARPFSLEQIYGMFPYFGNKFASGSVECRVVEVTQGSATLAMRFSDRTLRQFGPFRRRCTYLVCQSAQGIFAAVPARVHGLPPATLTNLSCVSNDDDWCRWLIRWQSDGPARRKQRAQSLAALPVPSELASCDALSVEPRQGLSQNEPVWAGWGNPGAKRQSHWILWSGLIGLCLAGGLWALVPGLGPIEMALAGFSPVMAAGWLMQHCLRKESQQREALIHEQIAFVESRHEELREAYLGQEQTRVELRRKVTQLTVLHQAGLLFSATLDRDTLLERVLETLTKDLHYDRAMVSMFDPLRSVIRHVRVIGASEEVLAYSQNCEVPVTDRNSPEGMAVLQGLPLLIEDVQSISQKLHPVNQRLAELSRTKSLIIVPLKAKDHILGILTVDRTHEPSLTKDDLELMTTLANQVAIALDNAAAYQQIEEWNVGLELKVRERTEALEQADRLRSQFLSHVSHELRTPMTSIKGFVQNLLDGLTGPLNEKQQRYLLRMLDNSDRLIRMIEDLLDRTRIEAGRLEVHPVDVDLESCLMDAIEQLRPLASAKRQRLGITARDARVEVWADRDRLIQVAVNLIQNAVKYTPEDGEVTVAIESSSPRFVRILVRDTGPGIPVEDLEKIFDPFFRVQQGQRSGPKGLGLGLSIVKTLVELQGGSVSAKNCFTGGAEVSFTLPLRSTPPSAPSSPPIAVQRVLVADGDPDIRQWLFDRLKASGYCPEASMDGQEALATIQSTSYVGVLLDIDLGQMDGLNLLQQIRLKHPEIPVIVMTASGSQELAVQAIGMGAQAYLLKPFDADALRAAMARWFQ